MGLFQNLFHRGAVLASKDHAWRQWWWRFPAGRATWHWCLHSRQRLGFFLHGVGVAILAGDLAMHGAWPQSKWRVALPQGCSQVCRLQLGLQVAGTQWQGQGRSGRFRDATGLGMQCCRGEGTIGACALQARGAIGDCDLLSKKFSLINGSPLHCSVTPHISTFILLLQVASLLWFFILLSFIPVASNFLVSIF